MYAEKRFELQHLDLPDFWLNDNKVLLDTGYKPQFFDVANGKLLYQQMLADDVVEEKDNYDIPMIRGARRRDSDSKIEDLAAGQTTITAGER